MSGVKNTIRLLVDPAKKDSIGLTYIVCVILEGLAGISKSEVFCLQDSPRRGLYDITFHHESSCLSFLACMKSHKRKSILEHIKFFPLFGMRERPMIVHLFNPYADIEVVKTYLEQYCDSVRGGVKQRNVCGIFNGKYKLWVCLKFEPVYTSGIKHPPANFSIAGSRGFLMYPGQPSLHKRLQPSGYCPFEKMCRSCGQLSHDGGDPSECDICGPMGNPRVNGEDEAMLEHETSMEDEKRVKTPEAHPTKTRRIDGVLVMIAGREPTADGGPESFT